MSDQKLTILINTSGGDDLIRRIKEVAPEAHVYLREQFLDNESLIEQADVVLGHLDGRLFPRAGRLKWLQGTSAGVDWLRRNDVPPHPAILTKANIHAESISEHLFGMLLMLARGIHRAHGNQPNAVWKWPGNDAVDILPGKTLCIVGMGVIGRRCAELGKVFGMKVIGVQRNPKPTPPAERVFGEGELLEALSQADVIMLLLPYTRRTDRLIGRKAFDAMKCGVYLLNAGRGRTVDTDALLEALQSGKVRCAGLDVTDPEPLPPEHPLWREPNVVITPHYSGAFPDYDRRVEDLFIANLRRFLAGQPLEGVVDREEGY